MISRPQFDLKDSNFNSAWWIFQPHPTEACLSTSSVHQPSFLALTDLKFSNLSTDPNWIFQQPDIAIFVKHISLWQKTIPNQSNEKNFNKKVPLNIAVLTPSNPVFFKLPFSKKASAGAGAVRGALGGPVFCTPFFQVIFVAWFGVLQDARHHQDDDITFLAWESLETFNLPQLLGWVVDPMHDASLLSSLMHFGAGCVSFFVSRCMSGNLGEVELVRCRSLYMFDLTVEEQKSSPKNIYLHLHQLVFQKSHLHRMSYQELSTA